MQYDTRQSIVYAESVVACVKLYIHKDKHKLDHGVKYHENRIDSLYNPMYRLYVKIIDEEQKETIENWQQNPAKWEK